jgi:ribokinase
MIRAAISGYATLDFVIDCTSEPAGAGTYVSTLGPDGAWPRAGGAALYAGRQLAAAGVPAAPVVGIGDDANGEAFRQACVNAGVALDALAVTSGSRTPSCVMAHHANGRCTCFLDPGGWEPDALTPAQQAVIEGAELVAITAGPPRLSAAVLDRIAPEQRLAWIVKADVHCFPPELSARIGQRADLVFRNIIERDFSHSGLAVARQGRIIVETRGGDGVMVHAGAHETVYPVSRLSVRDATGAGDTFAGAFLAAIMTGAGPDAAAKAAIAATGAFLRTREIA